MKIKTKDIVKGTIKTLDKGAIATERTKDELVNIKEKVENAYSSENETYDYASDKVTYVANRSTDEAINTFNNVGKKSVETTKNNIIKTKQKIQDFKIKQAQKKDIKTKVVKAGKSIKTGSKQAVKTQKVVIKNTEKVAKETVKASQRAKQMAIQTAKTTVKTTKVAVKATISAIKGIIAATKALVSAIIAGGWIAVIIVIVICLIGLLCSSVFGIFMSGQKTSANAITMNEVVAECNQEFSDKLQSIQDTNPHDDYVLDGSMAKWKDVLLVYTVKQSNGVNQQDVMTINDSKKNNIKTIFWDMNTLTSEVKTEMVTEQGVNTNELPKQVEKKVLHIKITPKSVEEMKSQYSFNITQNNQLAELSSDKYASLWNGVIYGGTDSGEYVSWRQSGASWSNIKIGNTNSTIGNIGCLVTSIAILIE
ncbi:MAG TPA: CHAP domain-containing protein, partial [Bacilli bacterium]|nr:CHAP domain-containing protein [Bacilli bacterium]